jgi:hypothetical protein
LGYPVAATGDDHAALHRHLKGKWTGVGNRLERLRLLRNDADYANDLPWNDAEIVVAEAIDVADKEPRNNNLPDWH